MSFNPVEIFLHLDRYLNTFFVDYGWVAYAVVFLILFVETGVVVMPFLPGDSLLFACGALAAALGLNPWFFWGFTALAAVLGNTSNYAIGRFFGKKLMVPKPGKKPLIAPHHLEETHRFFEKWGGWAVTLSRFFPFLRTFLPFIAGVGQMGFRAFILFNVLGGVAWTALFLAVGYLFGHLPFVKENFSLIVMGIIVVPALPTIIAVLLRKKKPAATNPSE
ncbi:MAG: VTT domain-containing protein [Spirochaetales bacterium]